ncbi:hypothetical protein C4577_03010 [Candidatus Parcubacteria bacterium]|nr:MAG: hypothetical protein C4577_03010 [Candidatus Parcubacteria bacterium]
MDDSLLDLVEEFEEQEKTTRTDGSVGVKNLCRLVRALGYKDWQNYGQFHHQGAYGDLFAFLEDNPGCIEAIKKWIVDQDIPEWREEITSRLNYKEEVEEE